MHVLHCFYTLRTWIACFKVNVLLQDSKALPFHISDWSPGSGTNVRHALPQYKEVTESQAPASATGGGVRKTSPSHDSGKKERKKSNNKKSKTLLHCPAIAKWTDRQVCLSDYSIHGHDVKSDYHLCLWSTERNTTYSGWWQPAPGASGMEHRSKCSASQRWTDSAAVLHRYRTFACHLPNKDCRV